jgi:catechol 2,3-dioxygenase-like lactoylglutathione lyase family enzyme
MSLDYIMIGTNKLSASRAFYDAVFPCFGGTIDADYPGYGFCYIFRNGTRAWIAPPHNKEAPEPGNGIMPGFRCATQSEVDDAYVAALKSGGSDEGAAGPRPMYGPSFYGAYVRDPCGNKLSFVFDASGGRNRD